MESAIVVITVITVVAVVVLVVVVFSHLLSKQSMIAVECVSIASR